MGEEEIEIYLKKSKITLFKTFLPAKYTKKKAVELGIRGWCKNTEEKTVTGQLEGPHRELSVMYASSLHFVQG